LTVSLLTAQRLPVLSSTGSLLMAGLLPAQLSMAWSSTVEMSSAQSSLLAALQFP
jgi:hypothetical protein